ncbi:hypothetical protein Csa_000705 [Cucumis sativus]|uniref:Uncharacterized protein n=1 Tax=Cucumis sativus TaxID=3659 RepID=A0A0A0LE98_CUCSA|nr:hypothetical protein Csa_000705 [Cucumis sativus]
METKFELLGELTVRIVSCMACAIDGLADDEKRIGLSVQIQIGVVFINFSIRRKSRALKEVTTLEHMVNMPSIANNGGFEQEPDLFGNIFPFWFIEV